MNVLDILLEAEAEPTKYYAIGDSHAEGIANYGGKNWESLAIRATASTDNRHKAAISKIPKGSTVAVCLGCNDAANEALRVQNKDKSARTPEQVASSVKSVVDACKAAGLVVVPVIYPPGTDKAANKAYNLPYAHDCRDAIHSALPDAIDMAGAQLYDGVHAVGSAYTKVAREIEKKYPLTKSTPSKLTKTDTPNVVASKETDSGEVFLNKAPRELIIKAQEELQKAGYNLGPTGVDGKVGKYTMAALQLAWAGKPPTGGNTPQLLKGDEETIAEARQSADEYLGRPLSETEWVDLLKVTAAEEYTVDGCGWVLGAILNRVNEGTWGKTVTSVVISPGQFQPVTGSRKKPGPGISGISVPSGNKLDMILTAAIKVLPGVPKDIINFSSNIRKAYDSDAGWQYRNSLVANGGVIRGHSVFSTRLA
jgi:hypothetical protein